MLYAVEIRRKFNIKEKKTTRDGREVLGGSSAKSCQSERNPEDCMVEVVEEEIDFFETGRQEEEGQEIGEFESDVSSYSGDLNISLLSCDSSEKVSASQKKRDEIPTPPTGWFCSLIIVWALLGPLSEEPAKYTDVAGSSSVVGNSVGKPTTLAGIKETAAISASGSTVKTPLNRNKVKMTLADHLMEKKLKLMEKSLLAAEETSEHIRGLNAEVALDASIKRKESVQRH